MPDLERIFADIAGARGRHQRCEEGRRRLEVAEKAMQLLGGLWQRIVETPTLLRQLTKPLSEAEWLRRYAPKTEAEQAEAKAVAMDWEAPDHEPGHG